MVNLKTYYENFENYKLLYFSNFWHYYRLTYCDDFLTHFKNLNISNLKILDLGGSDLSLPYILRFDFVKKYTSVDIAFRIKIENLKVYYVESDIISFLEKCKEKYDCIIFFGVLMYINKSEYDYILKRSYHLLNNNGMILSHDPNKKGAKNLDELGHAVEKNTFSKSLKGKKAYITQSDFNIISLRHFFCYIIKGLKISLFFLKEPLLDKLSSFFYFFALKIEKLLSVFPLGVDTKTIIIKRN